MRQYVVFLSFLQYSFDSTIRERPPNQYIPIFSFYLWIEFRPIVDMFVRIYWQNFYFLSNVVQCVDFWAYWSSTIDRLSPSNDKGQSSSKNFLLFVCWIDYLRFWSSTKSLSISKPWQLRVIVLCYGLFFRRHSLTND